MKVCICRAQMHFVTSAAVLGLLLTAPGRADDLPVATIAVSSSTANSAIGGRLVEGVMSFRGREYLLTLRGLAESVTTKGSVRGLLRPRDIEGVFKPSDQGLRNESGVTIRFDPPLLLKSGSLEIEVSSRLAPKVSGGHRDSGVE
jgi:hypothetical protein